MVPAKKIEDVIDNKYYKIFSTGIRFDGEMPFGEWSKLWGSIGGLSQAALWCMGDALNYGEHLYGEKYSQVLDSTKFVYGTLRNICWVCKNVNMDVRTPALTVSHHKHVAKLPKERQVEMLDMAIKQHLTSLELRDLVNTTFPELCKTMEHNQKKKLSIKLSFDDYWEIRKKGLSFVSSDEEQIFYEFGKDVWTIAQENYENPSIV